MYHWIDKYFQYMLFNPIRPAGGWIQPTSITFDREDYHIIMLTSAEKSKSADIF